MPDLNLVHPGAASHPVPPRLEPFAAGYAVAGLPARLLGVPFPPPAFFAEEDLSGVRWVACLSSSEPERRYAVPAGIGWLERCRFGGPESAGPAEWAEFARVAGAVRARLRECAELAAAGQASAASASTMGRHAPDHDARGASDRARISNCVMDGACAACTVPSLFS